MRADLIIPYSDLTLYDVDIAYFTSHRRLSRLVFYFDNKPLKNVYEPHFYYQNFVKDEK